MLPRAETEETTRADKRVVVTFRAENGPGRTFLDRARVLEAKAVSRGGVLIAWDALRLSFVFEEDELSAAVGLASAPGEDTIEDEKPWCVGIAQGQLDALASDGTRGALAWGPALLASAVLSTAAAPGEILCAGTLAGLRSGELLAAGTRVAREGGFKIRGVRLDPAQPFRRQAVEQIYRMRVAPLVGVTPPSPDRIKAGELTLVRADPGTGGTRYLTELATRASRSLLVSPSGSSFEPLGALRRALARSITRELSPMMLELAEPLEALLDGHGAKIDVAAQLVTAFLWPKKEGQGPGLLLLDDAKTIDPATLEACVIAARAESSAIGLVARLDATSGVPSMLATLPRGAEIEIAPLARSSAEALAGGCTNEALVPEARKRWARLGANMPLAIVESLAYGIVTGDITWHGSEDHASPRSRVSGRGKVRSAADWIMLRARDEEPKSQLLLALIAILGGEAKVSRLGRVLETAGQPMDVELALEELIRGRWVFDTQEDWIALPSRTHRDALMGLATEPMRKLLHLAAADVIEGEEGAFGRVEAAWHAGHGDDSLRASRILLASARATAESRLDSSTTQLIAFARRIDPTCEEAALEILANALERAPSVAPSGLAGGANGPGSRPAPASGVKAPSVRIPPPAALPVDAADFDAFDVHPHDSEPPTIAKLELAPFQAPGAAKVPAEETGTKSDDEDKEPSFVSGADIASRLAGLAKEALLSADNAALERWVDGLRATGENPLFTERLRALSRLGRGDIGDALRVLRRTRSALDPKEHQLRCQTSLALGVALSVAGRPQEALLEGMDALARARQVDDERGARACLAFLAKLYTSQGRDEAVKLRTLPPPSR